MSTLWQGADGGTAKFVVAGSSLDCLERFSEVGKLEGPAKLIQSFMLLECGEIVLLPFVGMAEILPDRTGVVAIFSPGQYVKDNGVDHFPAPNNAAIFNADGSLRFQLELGCRGQRIGDFHSGSMPDVHRGKMGVLVAEDASAQPAWVFAVDPDSPALIQTNQWVRY